MASFSSLESPSRLFSHTKRSAMLPTTLPKRTLEREFSFKSPEKLRLDFDTNHHRSREVLDGRQLERANKTFELETRVEIVLRNNKQLSDENQEMKNMLLIQRNQIDSLRARNTVQLDNFLTQQLETNNIEHRIEVEKLLSEITRLQQQFMYIENIKNEQINAVRNQLDRANVHNYDTLRRSQDGMAEAYEIQIQKLGDVIQFKQKQIEKLIITHRRQKDLLVQEIGALNSEYKHMLTLKSNEVNQLKFGYQSQLARLERQARQKEQTHNQAHETVIRRMNRQLNQRLNDIERLMDQIKNNNAEYNQLYKQMDFEKRKFEQELDAQMDGAKQKIKEEKEKMEALINKTIDNLNNTNEIKVKTLENQSILLKDLLKSRQHDLENQRQTLVVQRDGYRGEIDDLEKQNRNLRERIQFLTRQNLSSIEALKIKMATLHQADIKGLVNIHETRITSLSQELAEKNRQLEQMKTRLHQQMQGKLHLRKQYQLEVAKLKSKIMDLRIQMNAVQIQMKDNITSMKSQLDVTSQGLIKDRETKARTIKSYQDEMRKLRQTIESKDEQLNLVGQNSAKKQQYYKIQSQTETQKVSNLKRELQQREKRKVKELQTKQDEITRLKKQLDELKGQLVDQQALRKRKIKQLNQSNEIVQNKLREANKQIDILKDKIESLEKEVNLARGDVQTVRFEHQAAANQQRGKTKQAISKTHGGFKQYYQKRIKQLQTDKSELQTINTTQSQQINELIIKYKQLQSSLTTLLDSQKKLSDLETKIVNIGMDNNLVKNLAELVKRPFH